jgi:arabinose-5-phosphate isomerase
MDKQTIIATAIRTIEIEAGSVAALRQFINEDFITVTGKMAACKGRIIISGIGKSALIAQKIVATLNSTGTPSVFLHAADAIHGDLGIVQPEDIVIIISKSGDSPEIKVLVPLIKNFGNTLVGMVGNISSYLARQSDHILNTTVEQEACPNNLAPTSSTTVQMVMGDALAVSLMEIKGFNTEHFARFHPGGALGKKLYLRVMDLYIQNEKPSVFLSTPIKQVIMEITAKRLGATAVVDEKNTVLGIVTDGDLRRMLEKNESFLSFFAGDIMTASPKNIRFDALAVDALEVLRNNDISQLVVLDEQDQYAGILHIHDIIREGII